MSEKIIEGMEFDGWRKAWLERCVEQGHTLKKDRWGGVDTFVINTHRCNGPGCEKCGWSACMHCDWKGKKIPKCTEWKK